MQGGYRKWEYLFVVFFLCLSVCLVLFLCFFLSPPSLSVSSSPSLFFSFCYFLSLSICLLLFFVSLPSLSFRFFLSLSLLLFLSPSFGICILPRCLHLYLNMSNSSNYISVCYSESVISFHVVSSGSNPTKMTLIIKLTSLVAIKNIIKMCITSVIVILV